MKSILRASSFIRNTVANRKKMISVINFGFYLHERELQFRCVFMFAMKKALLEIRQPITFSRTVQPICISAASNTKNRTYDHEDVLISGWGNIDEEFAIGNFLFS